MKSSHDILLEGDVVLMECDVVYRGDRIPYLQWDQLIDATPGTFIASDTAYTRVTSTGILRINSSHDGSIFNCITFFDSRSSYTNVSRPGHDYNFTCMLSPINVACEFYYIIDSDG